MQANYPKYEELVTDIESYMFYFLNIEIFFRNIIPFLKNNPDIYPEKFFDAKITKKNIFKYYSTNEIVNARMIGSENFGMIFTKKKRVKREQKKKKENFVNNCLINIIIAGNKGNNIHVNLMIFKNSIKVVGSQSIYDAILVIHFFNERILQIGKNQIYGKTELSTEMPIPLENVFLLENDIALIVHKTMKNHHFHLGVQIDREGLYDIFKSEDYEHIVILTYDEPTSKTSIDLKLACPKYFDSYFVIINEDNSISFSVLDENILFKKNKKTKRINTSFTVHPSSQIILSGRSDKINRITYENFIRILQENEDRIYVNYQ